MTSAQPSDSTFREGDQIILSGGSYQGTTGVFIRLREDANWADITEWNGRVRMHPVVWLSHVADTGR